MHPSLRDRILRKLDTLNDERGYQVLDYVEFLESKYAEREPAGTNVFQRFADGIEDRLRAGQVAASTVAETMGLLNKAMGVLGGVAAAGKSVANDIVSAAQNTASRLTSSSSASATPEPPAQRPIDQPPPAPEGQQP